MSNRRRYCVRCQRRDGVLYALPRKSCGEIRYAHRACIESMPVTYREAWGWEGVG